jgi:hypothetical protein
MTRVGTRASIAVSLLALWLLTCSGLTVPGRTFAVEPSAARLTTPTVAAPSLPDWIANPADIPPGLQGQNNCTFPFGPGATGGIWNYHTDGACWERPGPDEWIRQQQNVVHVPEHAACGGGAADVSPIRICRAGGAGQPTPCDVNPTTGPLGCAICVRSVVCH